ncbi:homeobox domain protein, partial [Teladorsagia circumcincta]
SKKRQRTTFSQAQLHVLEEAFSRQQYLVGSERLRLAGLLNIGVTQVKVWFQNRRIRWRREQRQMLLNVQHHQPLHGPPSPTMISLNSSSSTLAQALDEREEIPSPTPTESYVAENFGQQN